MLLLVRSNDSDGIVVNSISLCITRRGDYDDDDDDDDDVATEVQTINSSVTKLRDGGTSYNFILLLLLRLRLLLLLLLLLCVVVTAAAAAVLLGTVVGS